MSAESAVAFWQQVQRDKSLQERVNPAAGDVPRLHEGVQAPDLENLTRIAQEAGFDCNPADFAGVEAVIRFWDSARSDKSLQRQLRETESMNLKEAATTVISIARESGYEFDSEQLEAVTRAHVESSTGETTREGVDAREPRGFEHSLKTALRGGWTAAYRYKLGPGVVAEYM